MLSVWILVTGENREIMAPCQQLLAFRRPEENGKRQLVKLLNVYREFWGIRWSETGISVSISLFFTKTLENECLQFQWASHCEMSGKFEFILYRSMEIMWSIQTFWCDWIFVVPVPVLQLNHSDGHHLFIIIANVHTQLIRELCVNIRSSYLSNCSCRLVPEHPRLRVRQSALADHYFCLAA